MKRATARDAVREGLFYFRKSLLPEDDLNDEGGKPLASGGRAQSHDNEYTLMNIDTIINGKVKRIMSKRLIMLTLIWPILSSFLLFIFVYYFICFKDEFPGVIPLVRMYVNSIDIDVDTRCTIMQYLRFISRKASGMLKSQILLLKFHYNMVTMIFIVLCHYIIR